MGPKWTSLSDVSIGCVESMNKDQAWLMPCY